MQQKKIILIIYCEYNNIVVYKTINQCKK